MTINRTNEGNIEKVAIVGRLDTTTAPALEAELKSLSNDITELQLDFKELEYVSSAGLRVLLGAQKHFNSIKGLMALENVSKDIMEVLELTGFIDILTIR